MKHSFFWWSEDRTEIGTEGSINGEDKSDAYDPRDTTKSLILAFHRLATISALITP